MKKLICIMVLGLLWGGVASAEVIPVLKCTTVTSNGKYTSVHNLKRMSIYKVSKISKSLINYSYESESYFIDGEYNRDTGKLNLKLFLKNKEKKILSITLERNCQEETEPVEQKQEENPFAELDAIEASLVQKENPFAEIEALNSNIQKQKEDIKIDWSQLEGVTQSEKQIKEIKKINGKKLHCSNSYRASSSAQAIFEFNNFNRVKIYGIDEKNEKIIKINGRYKVLSDEVIVNYKIKKQKDSFYADDVNREVAISRKNLTVKGIIGSSCKLLDDNESVSDKLNLMLKTMTITKSQGNKF